MLDGVVPDREDDRDRRGRSFGHERDRIATGRGDHRDATANEVGHERRQAIVLALQPVVLNHYVLALDVAGFVETFAERSGSARGGIGRTGADEAHDRHRRLLRARRERPRSCAANQRDELAPPHSITSSARAVTAAGTVRPSARAVTRLITRSNLVGCSTGRSAGLVPRRILST